MMKYITNRAKTIVVVTLLLSVVTLGAQGINFEQGNFKEALAKAKSENKIVFIDCYTTWCGPCKKMAQEVFPQKEVGDYINANFVSITMDMEKGEGIDLAKKYDVKAFPTLLFMDANGKVLHTVVGGLNAESFINEAKIASDPNKQLEFIKNQYLSGNRDLKVVSEYIKGLYNAFKRDEAKSIGNEVIPSLTNEQYNTEEGFTILSYTGVDFRSKPYNYVLDHEDLFVANEKIGQESVDYLISNAINDYVLGIAKKGTLEDLNAAIQDTKKDFVSPYQDMLENNWLNEFYLANNQFEEWFDSNIKQSEAQTEDRMRVAYLINPCYRVAMDSIFEPTSAICDKAIATIEQLKRDNEESLAAYYCLASLYKKVGNKKDALANINGYIKKSAEQGKESDKRVTDLKSEIESMD